MKRKKVFLSNLILILVAFLVTTFNIRAYQLYEYQLDEEYFKQLEESNTFHIEYSSPVENCNDYGCYEGTLDYYQSTPTENTNLYYLVLVNVKVKPKNDLSTPVTNTYVKTNQLEIHSDVNQEHSDVKLFDYFPKSFDKRWNMDVDFNLNHLLGKKDLNQASNKVSYEHESDNLFDTFESKFSLKDHVKEESLMTYYVMIYPKEEEVFKNTVKISVEFEKNSPLFLLFKSKDTQKLEQEYTIEFSNQ